MIKAFIFYTSGAGRSDKPLENELLEKGFDIIGEFSCLGRDTWGLFKLIGGKNKGRPKKEDLEEAKNFARDLLKKIEANTKSA